MLHRNEPIEGDRVPCQFKNLQLNPGAVRMICKNINDKLKLQNMGQRTSLQLSDIEQTSSYDRKIAYLIRFHLRDILTSDHRHVWFNIQTKSLDQIEDRTQILKNINSKEISVVYSFGSMLSYDTFTEHVDDRSLARISVHKPAKTIKLETATHCLTIPFKNIDSHLLINHSTRDQSIQIVFMLQASPIIVQRKGIINRDNKRYLTDIPLCSDLLVRFFPASEAWSFLRDLPIAGYSQRSSDEMFHINFALFEWKKYSSILSPMGMPRYSSVHDSYGMEMLWSLGHVFGDKYNANQHFVLGSLMQHRNLYDICCTIWRNLKSNHCYRIEDALSGQTPKPYRETSNESSQHKDVAFAIITPHRTEYQPLQMTLSHRGFALYDPQNWLLVHLRDHSGTSKINKLDEHTRGRIKNFMLNGITRDNRRFRYFGSSGSQMNDQAGWFLSLPPGITIEAARQQIGDLTSIHNVSTYIARVGLYLTTSKSAGIKLNYIGESADNQQRTSNALSRLMTAVKRLVFNSPKEQIQYTATVIPDIERHGHCFTDGCGKISRGLAKKVALNIGIRVIDDSDVPSAFQVRIAGCKGMLSIDPESKSTDFYIKLRKSMVKFDSDDWTLHIVDHSRPMPLSLNNQVIRLLSDLGNSNGVFESIQTRCIDRKEFWHPPAKSYLNALDSADQAVIKEKQQKYKNAKHFLLRNKIPLPLNEARCLFGIADTTGTLKAGECFIQYRDLEDPSEGYKVLEETVLVTKCPCLHPGDFRKLEAVSIPKLKACIRDCIVFSVDGYRPTCNEIAGSDLDGDQYWVYWGSEFQIQDVVDPLFYPPAKKSSVDRVTNDLIVEHVLETFIDKAPGMIANTHSAIADKNPSGTHSKDCKECAMLFARAIDARKTGENVSLDRIMAFKEEYCQTYPSWMMKFDKPQMNPQSTSINEILYRKAQDAWIHRDNYQDILRPFQNTEPPADSFAINVDDTDPLLEDENNSAEKTECARKCCCCCCFVIFVLAVIVVVWCVLNSRK